MATRFKLRLYLLAIVVVAATIGLVFRLYQVQIVEYQHWKGRLPGEKQLTVRVPGVRGEILDRNGTILASNRASYEVTFDLKEIYEHYKDNNDGSVPVTTFEAKRSGITRTNKEADIVSIVDETVLPNLYKLGLATAFNATQLKIHWRSTRGVVPYTYRRDLSFEDFALFAENDLETPGVDVTVKPQRVYPYDALACHLLGYVKLPDIETVPKEKRAQFNHYVPDDYGGAGIEKSQDKHLQGRAGKRTLKKDEKGVIREEIGYEAPIAGADVHLTIDARVQQIAENAMRGIMPLGDGTSGRGAVVVMDPRSGEILAMVSVPSFNPNHFIPSISVDDWKRYTEDRSAPMYNRALSQHAPGSTYKVPIALAGCMAGADRKNFYCGGGVTYGSKYMKCWIAAKGGRHGSINMSDALKKSCNCYFYLMGNYTGINTLNEITTKMGMGKAALIDSEGDPILEGEHTGLAPSPQWLKLRGQLWSDAFTAMTSIGQGFAEATPLQMAAATCTVANGGRVFQPRLIKKVVEKDGTVIVPDEPILNYDLSEEGLTKAHLELVKRGMWKVVNESGGTAGRARSDQFYISGKTGTAQSGKPAEPTNAWFISFAPYDEPEIAACVFVHNGDSGGRCGAPVAGRIIKQVMAMKHGYEVELEPLVEAKGHFERVLMVDFDNSGLDRYVEGDDADTAVDVELPEGFAAPSSSRSSSSRTVHQPTITPRADRRGSEISQRNRKVYQAKKVDKWKSVRSSSSSSSSDSATKKKQGLFQGLFNRNKKKP